MPSSKNSSPSYRRAFNRSLLIGSLWELVSGILFCFWWSCHQSLSIFPRQKEDVQVVVQSPAAEVLHLISWAIRQSTSTCPVLMSLSGTTLAAILKLHCRRNRYRKISHSASIHPLTRPTRAMQVGTALQSVLQSIAQETRHPIMGQLNWEVQACRTINYQLWLLLPSITICSRLNPNEIG